MHTILLALALLAPKAGGVATVPPAPPRFEPSIAGKFRIGHDLAPYVGAGFVWTADPQLDLELVADYVDGYDLSSGASVSIPGASRCSPEISIGIPGVAVKSHGRVALEFTIRPKPGK